MRRRGAVMDRLAAADPLRGYEPSIAADRGEADALLARLLATPAEEDREPERAARPDAARRVLVAAVAAVALLALALSPPGRAGLVWAAELIGIGDVGGGPTIDERGPLRPATGPVVVDNGRTPEGERYEWVAYRGGLPEMTVRTPAGGRDVVPATEGLCLFLDWPADPARGRAGGCSGGAQPHPPAPLQSRGPIQSLGVVDRRSPRSRVGTSGVVLSGTTGGAVHDLRISLAGADGRSRSVPVDFARVDGELARRAGVRPGAPGPFGVFVAFAPREAVPGDGASRRTHGGLVLVDERLRTGHPATDACLRRGGRRPPAGPLTLTATDRDGRAIDVRRTLVGDALPPACARRMFLWRFAR